MQDCRCSLRSAEERGKITLFNLSAVLLTQPGRPSLLPGHTAGLCPACHVPASSGPSQQSSFPICVIAGVFFLPHCRTLYLSLLNFIRFLLAHFFVLYRSLWQSALPQSILADPLGRCANWMVDSSRPLMRMLKRTGCRIDPCSTPLVIGQQFRVCLINRHPLSLFVQLAFY